MSQKDKQTLNVDVVIVGCGAGGLGAAAQAIDCGFKQERIHIAKDLLQNTILSISQIATAVGYQEYSYFYQVFVKHTKMAPGEYREKSI